ncbi:MAG: caspase family protein [Bacteroidia bacterium]|nr:caspase family protein [Bacteroidia bacterium]
MSILQKLLLLFCLSLSFSGAKADSVSASDLMYNGMYQSEKIGFVGNLRCYLKFYDDGTVIRTFSNLDQETPKVVSSRLNLMEALKFDSNVSNGKYTHNGTAVKCSFVNANSTETYTLNVIDFGLTGKYQGIIASREERYSFLPELTDPRVLFGNQPTVSNPPASTESLSLRTAPKVYAVVVGVAKYTHIKTLNYADDDAFRLYAWLKSPEGGALPDDQISLFIDEAARHDDILDGLKKQFSRAGANDLVLFYFSGHGAEGAFMPNDFDGYSHELTHATVREVFDQSKARYKICIADACHSGSLDKGVKSGWTGVYDSYYAALSSSSGGMALFMSSKAEETSLEIGGLRQSVFTYYLLDGLKGQADINQNKIVTIQELYNYVAENVKSYTANRQSPVINGNYDQNMPVGVLR